MGESIAIDQLLGGVPVGGERRAALPSSDLAVWQAGRGTRLWSAGEQGATWRVVSGVVGLWQPEDGVDDASARFVMLAYGGDLVGVEAQLFGCYAFEAVALTPVTLHAWSSALAHPDLYWQQAKRAHQVAHLRSGKAPERLRRFLALVEEAAPGAPWPRLRDIAAVTALQVETVSRLLAPRNRGNILFPVANRSHKWS